MKICIITVYNSENCGSYLQAYALGKTLEKMGHEVVYYKRIRNIAPPSWKRAIKGTIIKVVEGKHREIPYYLKTHIAFRKWEKTFNVITAEKECNIPCDCYFFGSDTLWNLESEHFLYDHEIYWGTRFKGKLLYTYAISVSNTSLETLEKYEFVRSEINNFTKLGVRDKHTNNVISNLTNKPIFDVCDPTLLLPKEDYDWLIKKNIYDRYILIYVFEDFKFSIEMKKEIIEYAKSNNLKIISLGEKRSWCDKSFNFSPDIFVTLFNYADNVITNTFHGTIFSIIYRKNFAAIVENKVKVRELLEEFKLVERNVTIRKSITTILNSPINYNIAENLINEKVLKSKNYIRDCIENTEKSI